MESAHSALPKLEPADSNMDAAPERETEDRTAVASYIAEMAAVLAQLARGCGFSPLAYTLDLSRLEAETLAGSRISRHSGRSAVR